MDCILSASQSFIRRRHVVPFEPGFIDSNSMVLTPEGMRSISTLQAGEKVISYHYGAVPILGVKTTSSPCNKYMRPVALRLSDVRNLMVSPTSLLMIRSKYSDLYFGSSQVLVQASSLSGSDVVREVEASERIFCSLVLERIDVLYVESFLVECRGADEGPVVGASLDFCNLVNTLGQYPILDDDEAKLLFDSEGGAEQVLQSNNLGEQ